MTTTTTETGVTTQVYQVFIKATPEAIWDALIKPEFTTKYFHGGRVETTGEAGAPMRMFGPDGATWGDECPFWNASRTPVHGRTGYYNEEHVARIELTRELQGEGPQIVPVIEQSTGPNAPTLSGET